MKNKTIILTVFFLLGLFCAVVLNRVAITKIAPKKQYRILVFMSSYKRPIFLSGQLLRLKNQTYKNFEVSVSFKGMETKYLNQTFMKEWKPFIDNGWLRFRIDKNRDQLANYLDTMRDIDLDKYDYFCKMDDDDWYAPDYLEDVNDWLNREHTVLSRATLFLLRNVDSVAKTERYYGEVTGPTTCLSTNLIKVLFALEKDANTYPQLVSADTVNQLKWRNEDALFDIVAGKMGKTTTRRNTYPQIIYGHQYPGISH